MIQTAKKSHSNDRPRLLVLASTFPRWSGDPEPVFILELSRRLSESFEVTVLCPHAKGANPREMVGWVRVVRYRYAPAFLETLVNDGGIMTNLKRSPWKYLLVPSFILSQFWHVWRMARRGEFDLVHAHWLIPQGLVAALQPRKRRAPFVVTSHGVDLHSLRGRLFLWLKRMVVRNATSMTVVSSAMVDLAKEVGAVKDQLTVIPMGVDVSERFSPDPSVEQSDHEILFVGRLVEKKGVAHLVRAMPAILRVRPDARLTIAGFGPDKEALERLVADLGLESSVEFLGALPQAELPALYRRAAVFVAPFIKATSGDQEGLPVALMEATACGCPVLAGDVEGLHDLLGEHAAEVVFDSRDEEGLATRVVELLNNLPAARARALKLGEVVRKRFDWDEVARDYADVLMAAYDQARQVQR